MIGPISYLPFSDFYAMYENVKSRGAAASRSEGIERLRDDGVRGYVAYVSGDAELTDDLDLSALRNTEEPGGHVPVLGFFSDGHLTINGSLVADEHEQGGFFYFAGGLTVNNVLQIHALINCPAPVLVKETCLCAYPEGYFEGVVISAQRLVVMDHSFGFADVQCSFAIGLGEGWNYRFPNDIVQTARLKAEEIASQHADIDEGVLIDRAIARVLAKNLIPDACDEVDISFGAIADCIRSGQNFLQEPNPNTAQTSSPSAQD